MSHNIYKSFSVKNGKCRYNTAESNVFDVTYDRNGRRYESYIFLKGEQDFQVDDPVRNYTDGSSRPNSFYGLSDIQLYAKLMLSSAYCGDRFYEARHKAVINAVHNWVDNKRQEDRKAFANRHNISVDTLERDSYKSEFRAKYGCFDDYRPYDPTPGEFSELVTVVEKTLTDFKTANRKQNVIIEVIGHDLSPAFINAIGRNGRVTISSAPKMLSVTNEILAKLTNNNGYKGYRFKITKG